MENCNEYKFNTERMLDVLKKQPQPNTKKALANIFGHLFAKAIERAENEKSKRILRRGLVVNYVPADSFNGTIQTQSYKSLLGCTR